MQQNRDINILVSDEQELVETIRVLADKGLISKDKLENMKYVKALRTNAYINLLLTYKEANIYSGDILLV